MTGTFKKNSQVSTSNHMFGRANGDKLPDYIFKNIKITRL